jgi:hypothetical protein
MSGLPVNRPYLHMPSRLEIPEPVKEQEVSILEMKMLSKQLK